MENSILCGYDYIYTEIDKLKSTADQNEFIGILLGHFVVVVSVYLLTNLGSRSLRVAMDALVSSFASKLGERLARDIRPVAFGSILTFLATRYVYQ